MTPTAIPVPTSMGRPLDLSPEAFGSLRESNDALADDAALRDRLAQDGYLLLRGVLDREGVLAARREIGERLRAAGALDPSAPLMDLVPGPAPGHGFKPHLTKDNAPLHRVLYEGPMTALYERLLGGPVRHFDFTWLRCVPPGQGTPPHYDVVYMGRGTKNLFTSWTPLGDVDRVQGGLMILEGSHRHERLKRVYGSRDVDVFCTNRPDPARHAHGDNGWLSHDPVGLRRGLKGRWLTSDFRAGDLLLFGMYVVHASLDNRSDRFRLSSDSRYQPASEPADERWVGENPVGHGQAGKRGRIC